jgi:hypothetical protein
MAAATERSEVARVERWAACADRSDVIDVDGRALFAAGQVIGAQRAGGQHGLPES